MNLSQLTPQYVPKIYFKYETDEHLALVMEKIEGITLNRYTTDRKNYDAITVAKIVQSLLGALSAIHKAGYVHYDFHGGNILSTNDYSVKLIDFSQSDDVNAIDEGDGLYKILNLIPDV